MRIKNLVKYIKKGMFNLQDAAECEAFHLKFISHYISNNTYF